jgi:hypothetical protein
MGHKDPERRRAYNTAYRDAHRERLLVIDRERARARRAADPARDNALKREAAKRRRANQPPAARPPLADRLWRRVVCSIESDGCWVWTGATTKKGYGVIGTGGQYGPNTLTHVLSYILAYGAVPEGKHVLHHCDNPPCLRPSHLWPGTKAENNRDAAQKGRTARGERHPHAKLTPDKVVEIRRLREAGVSYARIRAQFGVAVSTIQKIAAREVWAWVP